MTQQQDQKTLGELFNSPLHTEPVFAFKTKSDFISQEATWVAIDFYEERRWKVHVARRLAERSRESLLRERAGGQGISRFEEKERESQPPSDDIPAVCYKCAGVSGLTPEEEGARKANARRASAHVKSFWLAVLTKAVPSQVPEEFRACASRLVLRETARTDREGDQPDRETNGRGGGRGHGGETRQDGSSSSSSSSSNANGHADTEGERDPRDRRNEQQHVVSSSSSSSGIPAGPSSSSSSFVHGGGPASQQPPDSEMEAGGADAIPPLRPGPSPFDSTRPSVALTPGLLRWCASSVLHLQREGEKRARGEWEKGAEERNTRARAETERLRRLVKEEERANGGHVGSSGSVVVPPGSFSSLQHEGGGTFAGAPGGPLHQAANFADTGTGGRASDVREEEGVQSGAASARVTWFGPSPLVDPLVLRIGLQRIAASEGFGSPISESDSLWGTDGYPPAMGEDGGPSVPPHGYGIPLGGAASPFFAAHRDAVAPPMNVTGGHPGPSHARFSGSPMAGPGPVPYGFPPPQSSPTAAGASAAAPATSGGHAAAPPSIQRSPPNPPQAMQTAMGGPGPPQPPSQPVQSPAAPQVNGVGQPSADFPSDRPQVKAEETGGPNASSSQAPLTLPAAERTDGAHGGGVRGKKRGIGAVEEKQEEGSTGNPMPNGVFPSESGAHLPIDRRNTNGIVKGPAAPIIREVNNQPKPLQPEMHITFHPEAATSSAHGDAPPQRPAWLALSPGSPTAPPAFSSSSPTAAAVPHPPHLQIPLQSAQQSMQRSPPSGPLPFTGQPSRLPGGSPIGMMAPPQLPHGAHMPPPGGALVAPLPGRIPSNAERDGGGRLPSRRSSGVFEVWRGGSPSAMGGVSVAAAGGFSAPAPPLPPHTLVLGPRGLHHVPLHAQGVAGRPPKRRGATGMGSLSVDEAVFDESLFGIGARETDKVGGAIFPGCNMFNTSKEGPSVAPTIHIDTLNRMDEYWRARTDASVRETHKWSATSGGPGRASNLELIAPIRTVQHKFEIFRFTEMDRQTGIDEDALCLDGKDDLLTIQLLSQENVFLEAAKQPLKLAEKEEEARWARKNGYSKFPTPRILRGALPPFFNAYQVARNTLGGSGGGASSASVAAASGSGRASTGPLPPPAPGSSLVSARRDSSSSPARDLFQWSHIEDLYLLRIAQVFKNTGDDRERWLLNRERAGAQIPQVEIPVVAGGRGGGLELLDNIDVTELVPSVCWTAVAAGLATSMGGESRARTPKDCHDRYWALARGVRKNREGRCELRRAKLYGLFSEWQTSEDFQKEIPSALHSRRVMEVIEEEDRGEQKNRFLRASSRVPGSILFSSASSTVPHSSSSASATTVCPLALRLLSLPGGGLKGRVEGVEVPKEKWVAGGKRRLLEDEGGGMETRLIVPRAAKIQRTTTAASTDEVSRGDREANQRGIISIRLGGGTDKRDLAGDLDEPIEGGGEREAAECERKVDYASRSWAGVGDCTITLGEEGADKPSSSSWFWDASVLSASSHQHATSSRSSSLAAGMAWKNFAFPSFPSSSSSSATVQWGDDLHQRHSAKVQKGAGDGGVGRLSAVDKSKVTALLSKESKVETLGSRKRGRYETKMKAEATGGVDKAVEGFLVDGRGQQNQRGREPLPGWTDVDGEAMGEEGGEEGGRGRGGQTQACGDEDALRTAGDFTRKDGRGYVTGQQGETTGFQTVMSRLSGSAPSISDSRGLFSFAAQKKKWVPRLPVEEVEALGVASRVLSAEISRVTQPSSAVSSSFSSSGSAPTVCRWTSPSRNMCKDVFSVSKELLQNSEDANYNSARVYLKLKNANVAKQQSKPKTAAVLQHADAVLSARVSALFPDAPVSAAAGFPSLVSRQGDLSGPPSPAPPPATGVGKSAGGNLAPFTQPDAQPQVTPDDQQTKPVSASPPLPTAMPPIAMSPSPTATAPGQVTGTRSILFNPENLGLVARAALQTEPRRSPLPVEWKIPDGVRVDVLRARDRERQERQERQQQQQAAVDGGGTPSVAAVDLDSHYLFSSSSSGSMREKLHPEKIYSKGNKMLRSSTPVNPAHVSRGGATGSTTVALGMTPPGPGNLRASSQTGSQPVPGGHQGSLRMTAPLSAPSAGGSGAGPALQQQNQQRSRQQQQQYRQGGQPVAQAVQQQFPQQPQQAQGGNRAASQQTLQPRAHSPPLSKAMAGSASPVPVHLHAGRPPATPGAPVATPLDVSQTSSLGNSGYSSGVNLYQSGGGPTHGSETPAGSHLPPPPPPPQHGPSQTAASRPR
uniref:Myb-like domain-containing protein n=1 Tax=Chromera velia CCMP2878 TaxID=1169474 RepID=A0A0G4HAN3_9ALVE|eukprot:Cvel_6112.t1-p1 / transcript=Cvel_6112.t1 / gene=Cvel_6112 / organism=Chromera_velia_CCMP2878 / gene_product=hypothetical protein / transcript_product=hypothetical protein / location=Cvel_scaffold295:12203-27449(-) / protein_length=2264 / sequence_SO=supercontig / SO=protein_coding / is_pseudo=false